MWELESRIAEVKQIVAENDGLNVADSRLSREVDSLISVFYDDIGEIKSISLKSLFDLFIIKCLYVNRGSRDAQVIDYLSRMLANFLFARELLPMGMGIEQQRDLLLSLLEESEERSFQNLFEAYRRLGDNSLFLTGLFAPSLEGRRRHGWRRRRVTLPKLNKVYYIHSGKTYYHLASEHEFALWTGQKPILAKLSRYFEVYMDALNEMGERYILGFDMNLIADKMLDCFNLYRRTGNPRFLDDARKYAAILSIDRGAFPRLFRSGHRHHPLRAGPHEQA